MSKVTISLRDGEVVNVEKPPNVVVEIREYRIPDGWDEEVLIDADGDLYYELILPDTR